MSSVHHPQTEGSSEIMNRVVENYIRCYCSLNQDDWDALLPSAEFAFNSSKLDSTGYTPFELDLGWNPASPLDLLTQTPRNYAFGVDDLRQTLQASLEDEIFSHKLAHAPQSYYNSHKYQPHSYPVGDSVWLDKTIPPMWYINYKLQKNWALNDLALSKYCNLLGRMLYA